MLDIEPKDFALELAGTTLDFDAAGGLPAFSIPSLPNFDTFNIETQGAGTIAEEAYFSFMIKTADEVSYNILEGNYCSFTDLFYTYSFILIDNPQPDMTGWSTLKVNYLGKNHV